jgi:hypothetical protein
MERKVEAGCLMRSGKALYQVITGLVPVIPL